MEITFHQPASVPAGTYPATFQGVEERESKDGNPYWRWLFAVLTSEGIKEVSGVSSTKVGPQSKSFHWFTGLLGRKPQPDEKVRVETLVGRACMVVLEENGDGFANVTGVMPAARSASDAPVVQASTPVAQPDEELPF